MNVHFACNNCGKCCHGHHIALTLDEALRWASDGGSLIVLVEAFLANGYGIPVAQRDHAQRRSLQVRCGDIQACVAITFAVYNIGTCRYLTEDNRCGIYERRPLVCRIYPIEINPHIQLRRDFKDCPPETWDESGPAIYRNGRMVNDELARLIEQSRQADRDEIALKAEICRRLQIDVAALKGDGFTAYRPATETLLLVMQQVMGRAAAALPAPQEWSLRVSRPEIADQLTAMGAAVTQLLPMQGAFIPLAV